MNANCSEPVAHVVVDAKDALNVHVGLERCLDRMQLDAASLRDCCYACRQAAREAGEDELNRSWSVVFSSKDFRMVRLYGERLFPGLLGPKPEEVADNGAAMCAVQPFAARAPFELRGLRCLLQGLARTEQRTHVDAIVGLREGRNLRGRCRGHCHCLWFPCCVS